MRAIDPIHPGEQLREEFMKRLGLSAERLANDIGVPVHRMAEIVGEQAPMSGEIALRLSRYFGTTARFWLDLQRDYDLDQAAQALGDRLDREVKSGAADSPYTSAYQGPDRRLRPRLG
jgi:addiction module HigA family antidote